MGKKSNKEVADDKKIGKLKLAQINAAKQNYVINMVNFSFYYEWYLMLLEQFRGKSEVGKIDGITKTKGYLFAELLKFKARCISAKNHMLSGIKDLKGLGLVDADIDYLKKTFVEERIADRKLEDMDYIPTYPKFDEEVEIKSPADYVG